MGQRREIREIDGDIPPYIEFDVQGSGPGQWEMKDLIHISGEENCQFFLNGKDWVGWSCGKVGSMKWECPWKESKKWTTLCERKGPQASS